MRSGNVLFLILLAVALFAALGYAVTRATGGGVIDISAEQSDLDTAKQQSIQANIDAALWRLKLVNGCRDNEISYETPSGDNENPDAPLDNSCHVYHPAGGGVPYIPLGDGDDEDSLDPSTVLQPGDDSSKVITNGIVSVRCNSWNEDICVAQMQIGSGGWLPPGTEGSLRDLFCWVATNEQSTSGSISSPGTLIGTSDYTVYSKAWVSSNGYSGSSFTNMGGITYVKVGEHPLDSSLDIYYMVHGNSAHGYFECDWITE